MYAQFCISKIIVFFIICTYTNILYDFVNLFIIFWMSLYRAYINHCKHINTVFMHRPNRSPTSFSFTKSTRDDRGRIEIRVYGRSWYGYGGMHFSCVYGNLDTEYASLIVVACFIVWQGFNPPKGWPISLSWRLLATSNREHLNPFDFTTFILKNIFCNRERVNLTNCSHEINTWNQIVTLLCRRWVSYFFI